VLHSPFSGIHEIRTTNCMSSTRSTAAPVDIKMCGYVNLLYFVQRYTVNYYNFFSFLRNILLFFTVFPNVVPSVAGNLVTVQNGLLQIVY